MAAKTKRPKKHSKKQQVKAKKQPQKQQLEKSVKAEVVAKPTPKPAASSKPTKTYNPAGARVVALILLVLIGVFVVIAANTSDQPKDVQNVSSHDGEELRVKVVGDNDGDLSSTDANNQPSTEGLNALQSQTNPSQGSSQNLQPVPTTNLQAGSTPDSNALNVN